MPILKYTIAAVFSLVMLLFLTNVAGMLSTEKQLRHYFDMPAYVGPVSDQVESAALKIIPLGTSRPDVTRILDQRAIGTDGSSTCASDERGTRLVCTFFVTHHSWQLMQEVYSISFEFDKREKVRKVGVRSQFVTL